MSFSQVCAKRDGLHCATDNAFLAMKDYMTSPDFELTYPVVSDDARGRDYELASHLGGLKFKANTAWQGIGKSNNKIIVNAKAMRLVYVLDPNLAQSRVWERTALAFTLRLDFPAGHLFAISSRTLEEKVTENMHGALEFLPHTVLVLVAFVALTTMTSDPVEGKVYLAGLVTRKDFLLFSHLSKVPSDLKENGTKEKTQFSVTVFHTLSLGAFRFVARVSFIKH